MERSAGRGLMIGPIRIGPTRLSPILGVTHVAAPALRCSCPETLAHPDQGLGCKLKPITLGGDVVGLALEQIRLG